MKARELTVEGAYVFTPEVFHDDRGAFLSPYQEKAVGAPAVSGGAVQLQRLAARCRTWCPLHRDTAR